ncbi:MAG: winged helix-turn-helix domain-containing protein [Nanoarchaeota archaeon]|nr:winged helix-turn-helix domain-containing protein [Nanoarchaeota archaeon]MBU1029893.1 winged helix-turn-helix domain-containing protein [Nanoarchaeota archaeon]
MGKPDTVTNKKLQKQSRNQTSSDKKLKTKTRRESEYLQLKGFLSFLILHELKQKRLCGEDLAKKVGARKGVILTPGTIYPALKKLRNKKLVKYKRDGRKKNYFLTEIGEGELEILYELFSDYFYGLKHLIKRN